MIKIDARNNKIIKVKNMVKIRHYVLLISMAVIGIVGYIKD